MIKREGLEAVNKYMDEVAEEVSRLDPGAQFLNPVAWQWYSIGSDVIAVED